MKKLGFIIGLLWLYTALCFPQQQIDDHIDKVGSKAARYVESQLPPQAIIAIVNNLSDEAAEVVFHTLESNLVNNHIVNVVERNKEILQLIKNELDFQLSGEVSDDSLVPIGKKLGAQYIVYFSVKPQGGIRYRLYIKAIKVETAQLFASETYYFQRRIKVQGQVMAAYRLMQTTYNETPSAIQPGDVYIELGFQVQSKVNIEDLSPDLIKAVSSSKDERKNICFVIDISGSMEGWKLAWVKREFKRYFEENISEDDIISVVAFDNTSDIIIEPMQIKNKSDREACINKIDALQYRGGTLIAQGLNIGYDLIRKNKRSGYINRVILLTDGVSNTEDDKKAVEDMVKKHRNEYNIGTIALSDVADTEVKDFMTRVAELGGGLSLFVDQQHEAQSRKEELDMLINTPSIVEHEAYQLDIRLTAHEGVILKYASEENTGWNQDLAYYRIDITGNEHKTILVTAQVTQKALQTGNIVDIEITGDIPKKKYSLSLKSPPDITPYDKTRILSIYHRW